MTDVVTARTRTFTWHDPALTAGHLGQRSGVDTLRAMVSAELPRPPVMDTLGIERIEVDEGRVTVVMTVREFHYNLLGSMHGGVLATLLDTAAGCAVHSTLPAGVGYTSVDLNTRFLRPVTIESGVLRCEGTVVSRSGRTVLAEARLADAAGQLMAHATSSCRVFPTSTQPPA